MADLVLATRNRDKAREVAALLSGLPWRIRMLSDFPGAPEVVEDGETCEVNAIKKATEIAKATGHCAVADDTGLEVDALEGRPGVYAARYAGLDATYEDNCRKLLKELDGIPWERRTARFVTVAVWASPTGEVITANGVLEGVIADQSRGEHGFGYDPVFYVPELDKTLAELTPEEKNRISHRAKAFLKLRDLLQSRA
ncbi:MAG: XTP/dITP diphosphatase [Nitrospira sp.]|nr:XTP/dITP diphosphatase [Nitrospira sp.]MCP9463479.1 XTP/dITP diphosphatase [Nitrospira sp.]